VTHGHISVGGRRITVPGYLVSRKEEETVTYAQSSPVFDTSHPVRKGVEAAARKATAEPGPRPRPREVDRRG
jgi:small subunit ribosomal protein S4